MEMNYKTYNIDGLGTIRTVTENDELWFYVIDVLRAIDISASAGLTIKNSSVLSAHSRKIRDMETRLMMWVVNACGVRQYISRRAEFFARNNTEKELALCSWVDEVSDEYVPSKPRYKTVRSLAKDLNFGCRELYKKLLDDNILESVDGVLLPTQQTKLSGLMALVMTRNIYDTQYNVSSYVTDKGCKYITEKYSKVG